MLKLPFVVLVLGICGFWLAQASVAQDKPTAKRDLKSRTWVEGKLACIGCSLAGEFGADAQCTLHAKHALGFVDKEGKLWTLVDNARGHRIITADKLRDKEIRIYGWQYAKHQYLEAWKYEIKKDGAWAGWDYCKTCGFEPGDNKDTDLCDDCKDR
ncbi:MAG: hypothetical protein ACKVX7_00705 [Planctomycetota bacterium]